jgi:large subunit ribosomal protein L15
MPLTRRVPKRGFTNIFRTRYQVVNLAGLVDFSGAVTPDDLVAKGLVRPGHLIKVLGDGEIKSAIQIQAHKFSASAKKKIEAAGGSCEVLES